MESVAAGTDERHPQWAVHVDVVDDHILVLTVDRAEKKNAFTPKITDELELGRDIVIAASDLRMCQLEPKRGLAPLGGATVRYVQRAGWGNIMYHLLRADEFGAAEAYRIGLVQEVVEPGQQREGAVELARELLQCSPTALRHTIANARVALDQDEPAAIAAIPAMDKIVQATEDFQEGINSFFERRPARFTGRRPTTQSTGASR